MSLEEKIDALTVAIDELRLTITDGVQKAETKKPEAKKPEAKKPEAKKPEAKKPEEQAQGENKSVLKAKMQILLEKRGPSAFAEILKAAGLEGKKMREVPEELYPKLIGLIDDALAPSTGGALTLPKLREKLTDVRNHPELGNDALMNIFDKFGVAKIKEVDPEDYQAMYDACEDELKTVEAEA
jgi:hypothetical protein